MDCELISLVNRVYNVLLDEVISVEFGVVMIVRVPVKVGFHHGGYFHCDFWDKFVMVLNGFVLAIVDFVLVEKDVLEVSIFIFIDELGNYGLENVIILKRSVLALRALIDIILD